MLNTLFNLTSEPTTNYLSLIYQILGFTFTNISPTYAVCGSIIVLCMFATTLRNLIYKVLNLAVLSVFVVALWAYLTDVTFIYVVYILTFVSAVVMLFLSVVLMLPSSAIAVTKRNEAFTLLFAVGTSENTTAYTIGAQIVYFILLLAAMLCLAFIANNLFKKLIQVGPQALWKRLFTVADRPMHAQPSVCGVVVPDFIVAVIKRYLNAFAKNVLKRTLNLYNFACDFPHICKLGPNLLNDLSKDPIFKGRYTLAFIVCNFSGACIRGLEAGQLWFNRLINRIVQAVTFASTSVYVECALQFLGTVSLFFIAIPRGIPGYVASLAYNAYFAELMLPNASENLAAIQYGLYIGQPFLIIVSITGLLVALIGAPFFVSRGN